MNFRNQPSRPAYQAAATTTGTASKTGLRAHMIRVYNYLTFGLLLSAFTAGILFSNKGLMNSIFQNQVLLYGIMFAPLAMILISMAMKVRSLVGVQTLYWSYCAVQGMGIGLLVYMYIASGMMDPMGIVRVFLITASLFAGLSLFGYTTKRDISMWVSFLVPLMIGLIVVSIISMFIQSNMLEIMISAAAVLIFSGMIAWQTHVLKRSYAAENGENANHIMAVYGALNLYISFVALFMNLLRLMRN